MTRRHAESNRTILLAQLIALTLLLALSASVEAAPLFNAFTYGDTASARQHWQPVFGSQSVRAERDGGTCIAFDAEFAKRMDRGCWDWSGRLDLSAGGRIRFEMQATGGPIETIMVYFGTPDGWYSKGVGSNPSGSWETRTLRLDGFGTEEKPNGWDAVDRFRFSVWGAGPGKVTMRIRNFRFLPKDPGENFLANGSFEVPGVGVPYAWGSGHWGVAHLPWAADMDLWRRHWHLDRTMAKHGTNSLLIDNADDLPLLNAVSTWFTPPKGVKTCVMSAWLKTDRETMSVVVSCGDRALTVQAGSEWRQVSLPGIKPKRRMIARLAPKVPGKLWIDAVQVQGARAPTAEFHPASVDESLAVREARVDWSPPRRRPDVAAGRSISGPTSPATVMIDSHGRFLLDGKPYLQHSFGLEYVSDLDILNSVAAAGFKDICIQIRASVTPGELKEIFDRCAEVGLRVIPWLDGRIPRERFREHIQTLKQHPALLCWYVFDEPSGKRFAEADARYRLARELDPSHPALINYLTNRLEKQTGDIYSTDVYPVPHRSPNAAIHAVQVMKKAAARENKPVWMWLQGTGYAYSMAREPSPRELSCMVYGSLISGARGIYYFAQFPRTAECFNEMRAMCIEVDALAPVLYSLETAPRAVCSKPAIFVGTYSLDGVPWVLAVNTQAEPCTARFEIRNVQGASAEVVFEARLVRVADSAWEDAFGPYERHVYRLARTAGGSPIRRGKK